MKISRGTVAEVTAFSKQLAHHHDPARHEEGAIPPKAQSNALIREGLGRAYAGSASAMSRTKVCIGRRNSAW